MNTEKFVKIASITVSVVGMGLNVASGVIEDKKLDMKIAKEVSKRLKNR